MAHDERQRQGRSTDAKLEHAKDRALGVHDSNPGPADLVGEATGGIGGALAGAAIGTLGGPVGVVVGGVAGAFGGWWAGRAVSEAATAVAESDETYFRRVRRSRSDASTGREIPKGTDETRP
jgi:phage tail tape-measure protein